MQKRNVLLSIISGVVLASAFPRPGIYVLAWVGLVPLFIALRKATLIQSIIYGLITGLTFFGIILFWISLFGYLPWILVSIVEAVFIAAFALISARIQPNKIGWFGYFAVPAAWTAMQWARSLGTYSLTWGSFAHSQANNLPIAQLSSITGTWGIDFLICLFNLAAADILVPLNHKRRYIPGVIVVLSVISVWFIGYNFLSTPLPHNKAAKIAIIQGNTNQDVVVDSTYLYSTFNTFTAMSRSAAKSKPDFIVWPETTLPTIITNTLWSEQIASLAKETSANFIVGAYDSQCDPRLCEYHNGAHFYNKSGKKLGVYRKVHLVPYGEFVPLRERLPFLKRYAIRDIDVLPGKSHILIKTDIGKVGVNICFESLFSQISRQETQKGAVVLFVLTDDSWFGRIQAARLHLMMSRLRAIENRRYVVRAAATGISAIIDPYGRVIDELGIFKQGIVSGRIQPMQIRTLYVRWGDYFAYICLGIVVVGLVVSRCRREKA